MKAFHRTLLAALAVMLAVMFAWYWQGACLDLPLEKDARGFYDLARQDRPFYAASIREPLFPALLQVALKLGRPANEQAFVRQVTGSFGLALIVAVGALAWRLAGPGGGAVAAWMFAVSSYTVVYAASGLREPVGLLLLVLLTLVLLSGNPSCWVWAGLIPISAALPLLRLEFLLVLPLILTGWVALGAAAWKRRVLPAVVAATVAWVVTLPFLISCRQEYGSYFALTAHHATYWRNHEFAGQPGHFTREEVIANAYAGERVATSRYIFGDHSLPTVLSRFVRGYWISLTTHIPILFSWERLRNPLIWCWLIGAVVVVRAWRTQGVVLWVMLIAQLPFAFIVPLDTVMPGRLHAGVEFRFSLPLAPFVAALAAVGLAETAKWVRKKWWA